MRSAEQARTSTVSHVATASYVAPRILMVRLLLAVLATLALLFTWHPVVLRAQAAPPANTVVPTRAKSMKAHPPKPVSPKAIAVKDTASTTHVVKAGETLWSITTRYYGDGHQWRVVARRNGIAISGDTALRIGAKLIIPSRRSAASVSSAASSLGVAADTSMPKFATTPAAPPLPAPKTSGPVVTTRPSGALASQTAGKANASMSPTKSPTGAKRDVAAPVKPVVADGRRNSAAAADTASMTVRSALRPTVKAERLLSNAPRRIGLVDNADLVSARPRGESPTVFLLRPPDASVLAAAARAVVLHAEIAPRRGEYEAAPFPIADAKWEGAGRLLARLDAAGVAMANATRMQLADDVEIVAPLGARLSVGDRLVAVRRGAPLASGQSMGVPSGILQVTRADAGKAIHATVRSLSGVMEQGDALYPVEGSAAPVAAPPQNVAGRDVETSVSWIDANASLPTLQSFVLLAAGQSQGVKAGEEFALYRRASTGAEDRIAVVRVVRVGASGSTAIVVRQSLPEIAFGARARRIARMP